MKRVAKKPRAEYRPRLSVEITEEQYLALQKYLDFGMQKRVFSIIVDDVIRMFEKYGRHFLAAVILKELPYNEYTSVEVPAIEHKPDNSKEN